MYSLQHGFCQTICKPNCPFRDDCFELTVPGCEPLENILIFTFAMKISLALAGQQFPNMGTANQKDACGLFALAESGWK